MYIVIETHGGPEYAIICLDKYGENEVFDNKFDADKYAEEECQDGVVVEI